LNINNLAFEKKLWEQDYCFLAGIDEVGRGPLAGPVVACAIIFDKSYYHSQVKDSKSLSENRREQLSEILRSEAISFHVGDASVQEIEQYNIRQATFMAMKRAISGLSVAPDFLLIDGENLPDPPVPSMGIIKGDQKSFSISAASIVAKVARDKYMKELEIEYPQYKFAKNKGYGTKEHIQAIRQLGPSPHHRKSFLKKILTF
jgi:ribonuclease HII